MGLGPKQKYFVFLKHFSSHYVFPIEDEWKGVHT